MNIEIHALQDLAAPDGICFGYGSKNTNGLRIKSYWDIDNLHVVMTHIPDTRYVGWPSLVYGGLISCLVERIHASLIFVSSREANKKIECEQKAIDNCRWHSHCGGLFQLPVAA